MEQQVLHAIVGTAGHIDHGKTALVRALTGCDTDRLKEEKERGISIDLGFAALDLEGRRVGIVDVPGHERFIRNMLAGAHAVDLVLFAIAADDGVMPQSEEHLDVVHLLGVERAVVALTKSDLVAPARLDEVREEIAILFAGTRLEGAPVVAVSATTGAGLAALRAELARQLATIERPAPAGHFRLPVDRAFVIRGHGVIVTGTAVSGTIAAGAEVHVLPGGARARVRSVEVHGQAVAEAGWRQRVALNLVGLERTAVTRGHVVADPRVTLVTTRFDARVELRPGARKTLRDHARLRVHLGTAEAHGTLVLLDGASALAPRSAAYAQLVLRQPVVALRGDRFVVRAENAPATLGGGEVVLPLAERHRRGDAGVLARLETLRTGDIGAAAVALLELGGEVALEAAAVAERLNVPVADVEAALRQAPGVHALPDGPTEVWTTTERWEAIARTVVARVGAFHTASPLLPGMEMEALRGTLPFAIGARLFRAMIERLAEAGTVVRAESLVALPGHRVTLGAGSATLAGEIEAALAAGGLTPPDLATLATARAVAPRRLGEVLAVLEAEGRVVRVAPDLWYAAKVVAQARAALEDHLRDHTAITAAEFRDRLGVSRKFSIALLDYFDRNGVTLRVGDARKLRHA